MSRALSSLLILAVLFYSSSAARAQRPSVPADTAPAPAQSVYSSQVLQSVQSSYSGDPAPQTPSPQANTAPAPPTRGSGTNQGAGGATAPASGAVQLTAAFLPPSPNPPNTVQLTLQGNNFVAGMQMSVTGPGLSVAATKLTVVNPYEAYALVNLGQALDLISATYKVHLLDSKGVELAQTSLDLENLVSYGTAQETPASGATVKQADRAKRKQAADLERKTKADKRLALAKLKAEAAQRDLYLASHPDVQPPLDYGQSAGSVVNSYCQTDSAAESTYIRVRRSLVDPKEASDSYGRRLGRHFLVFEITVENNNANLQYILHDVSVDLSRLHHMPAGSYRWAFSGQDLIMLRGVPEKGADLDPRNLTYHVARGVGAVAGGVSGIIATGVQDVFAGATAAFNGPLLSGFIDIFPDHTATQLNRLSDSAFTANVVVAKQSAKTFAIFVPEGLFLTHKEQNEYWKEPIATFGSPEVDFRQADVCVDGAFISEVAAVSLSSVTYDDVPSLKAGGSAKVTLHGANFATGDTSLDVFSSSFPLSSVDGASGADATGTVGHATVTLPANWVFSQDYQASVESKKTGQKSPAVTLGTAAPEITSIDYADRPKTPMVPSPQSAVLTIKGTRLRPGLTMLEFNVGASGASAQVQEVPVTGIATDGTSGQATVTLPVSYTSTSTYSVQLKDKDTGALSPLGTLPTPAPAAPAPKPAGGATP